MCLVCLTTAKTLFELFIIGLKLDGTKECWKSCSAIVQSIGDGGPGVVRCCQVGVQCQRTLKVLEGSGKVHLHVPAKNTSHPCLTIGKKHNIHLA